MNKQRIWEILEISKENDKHSKVFDYFISILIGLNVVAIILETENKFFGEYESFFRYFVFYPFPVKKSPHFRLWNFSVYIISP